jgi:hypothetical protein
MRVASRVIGVALALGGLGFLLASFLPLLFVRESVLVGSRDWKGPVFGGVFGVGFLLAGWYYFRLDVDALDAQDQPPSRFALYFLAHRRELKVIAHVGFAISLIRFGALCFGIDWPGRRATLVLLIVGVAIPAAEGTNAKRQEEGRPFVKLVRSAVGAAMCILLAFLAWSQYSHQQAASGISLAAIIVLLFASESMETWSITASSR